MTNNQKEYSGIGSLKSGLSDILTKTNSLKPFVVSGRNSFNSSGAKPIFDLLIPHAHYFRDFSQNPKLEEINLGFEIAQAYGPDLIIGIGGGSAMDVAKAIKLFYYNVHKKNIPLLAIPTTAGSGSESTWFIVYYEGKNKISEGKPEITLPEYFILDSKLSHSLPKSITASSSMDAFAQAVESYWSIYSTEESKKLSKESLELLIPNIVNNVNHPTPETREKIMKAANLSGKAINITKTTACHSIAYPITSYFGVPHGHAVGLTLGDILVFNSEVKRNDCNDSRGPEYVKKTIQELSKMIGADSEYEAKEKINHMMKEMGLKTSFSELGISKDDTEIILNNGFKPERVANNPRHLTRESLREVLLSLS